MNPRPNIQVAPDIRLDDDFAMRIVRKMLEAIEHDTKTHLDKLANRTSFNGNLGNPKGQRRYFEALKKDFGPALLSAGLPSTGTNKRFCMTLDLWMRGERHMKNWLLGVRLDMIGVGANRPVVHTDEILAGFTHHALVRLVQRAKCARPEDLIRMLRRSWGMVQLMLRAHYCQGVPLPWGDHPGWFIPVPGIDGTRVCLVVKQGKSDEPGLVVTTILTDRMLVDPTTPFEKLRLLDERHETDLFAMANDPDIGEALEATSKASRRSRA